MLALSCSRTPPRRYYGLCLPLPFNWISLSKLPIQLACGRPSPVKYAVFPSISPPHLLLVAFGSMDFALFSKLVQLPLVSLEVRVLRAGCLPPASFRFRLATDTLALS